MPMSLHEKLVLRRIAKHQFSRGQSHLCEPLSEKMWLKS